MKNYFLLIFCFLVILSIIFVALNKEHLEFLNLQNLLIYYQNYKLYIDDNKFLFGIIYILVSTLWICFLGIMTPMLILSTLMFEYLAIILSIISFSTGSTISYLFAKKFKNLVVKKFEKITVKENPFLLYIIFRFIPGVPYILKNISGIFFKLKNKNFVIATIIADTPQIFLIVFLIKRFVDSSKSFENDFDIMLISEQLFFPFLLIVLFLIIVFFIHKKFKKIFFKK